VHDRESPTLWLALTDEPTPWRNANPGRTDLPRTIEDRPYLSISDVDTGHGWRFDRTTRPAQGRLTEGPTRGLLIVLISPKTPDQAQALRDWADFVHLSHIAAAAVPGFTTITPYQREGEPRFLHLYQMDTDDPEAAFSVMPNLVGDRLGGMDTPAWKDWAFHPALRIDYVQTFSFLER